MWSAQNFVMGSLTDDGRPSATPYRRQVLKNTNPTSDITPGKQTFKHENNREWGETQLKNNKKNQATKEIRLFGNENNKAELGETQLTENEKNQETKEKLLSVNENNQEERETQLTTENQLKCNHETPLNDKLGKSSQGFQVAGQFNEDTLNKVFTFRKKIKEAAMLDFALYVPLMTYTDSSNLDLSFEDLETLEGIDVDGLQSLEWTVEQMQKINDEEGDVKAFITVDEAGNLLSSKSLCEEMKTDDLECHEVRGRTEFVGADETRITADETEGSVETTIAMGQCNTEAKQIRKEGPVDVGSVTSTDQSETENPVLLDEAIEPAKEEAYLGVKLIGPD